ncbi:MAG: hypothetical protein AAF757_02720 [Cyanobacteria bacterium P01_D01_bin.116]
MNNVLAGFGLDVNNLDDIQSRFEKPDKPKEEIKPETNKSDVTGLDALAGFSGLGAGLETLNKKSSSSATKSKDNTDREALLKALDNELDPDKKFIKHTSLKEVSQRSKDKKRLENVAKSRKTTTDEVITLNLAEGCFTLSTDAEYIPDTNYPTIPLCIQFADGAGNSQEYLHPNHPYTDKQLKELRVDLDALGETETLHIFEAPNAVLDYYKDTYGVKWRESPNPNKRRYTQIIDLHIFFSFKDLQYNFKSDADYQFFVLTRLERIRRITSKFNRPIPLPYEMQLPSKKGNKLVWKAVSLNVLDVSAMQGSKGLSTYLGNVGMSTDDKNEYEKWEKSRMDLRLLENPARFLRYIRSDVNLHTLKVKTIEFYNQIAELIGVEPRDEWGMSTGKITANMISEWLARKVELCPNDLYYDTEGELTPKDTGKLAHSGMYRYNRLANPEAIREMSHLVGNKKLLYLGMTDGGRCVKERVLIDFIKGVLVDIDIMSCYASGLLNQLFPIGNPKIIHTPMNYEEWEKKYSKNLVPGLWVARISWKDAPFKQDLLISKEEKQFTAWDFYQQQYGENGADNRDYDASMYLMTNDINQAAYTHDQMQVIHKYSANSELAWIRKNAIIESFAFYPKDEEIEELTEDLLTIKSIDEFRKGGFEYDTGWKRVELREVMSILINRRQSHKGIMKHYDKLRDDFKQLKKDKSRLGNKDIEELEKFINDSEELEFKLIEYKNIEDIPQSVINYWNEIKKQGDKLSYKFSDLDYKFHASIQEFIKLIGNTVYGCIASAFFGGNGTGLSNYVVGNNITARARTLAWCMAKGFHSLMSITDGGVFDANKVLSYRHKSLDIFANVAYEYFSSGKNKVVDIVPLYDCEIPFDASMKDVLLNKKDHVEQRAWEHLKNIFGELDIFALDQFGFEVKKVYTECTLRNKSDYILKNEFTDKETIRIRGVKKDDNSDEMVQEMFTNIQQKSGKQFTQKSKRMLGLGEWRAREELRKELLPHDEVETTKDFFTLTPLGCRFINSKHRKKVLKAYDTARVKRDAKAIARIKELESMRVYTSRGDGLKDKESK